MATKTVSITLDAAGGIRKAVPADVGAAATAVADAQAAMDAVDQSATDTALGVLDADGASPTEAHVNDAVTAFATLDADIETARAAIAAVSLAAPAGLTVSVDDASITNLNQLRTALNAVYTHFAGQGMAEG